MTEYDFVDDVYQSSGKSADQVMQDVEENLLALKQSFASSAQPSNPVNGMPWLDTDTGIWYMYYNGSWVQVFDLANALLKIATSIGTSQIQNYAVDTLQLAVGAVETNQLANDAVTNSKIADSTIQPQKFEDYVAGDYLIVPFESDTTSGTTIPNELWRWRVSRGGTITVRVGVKANTPATAYYAIYKNGVTTGETGSTAATSYQYTNHDISVDSDDLIAIHGRTNNASYDCELTATLMCSAPQDAGKRYY